MTNEKDGFSTVKQQEQTRYFLSPDKLDEIRETRKYNSVLQTFQNQGYMVFNFDGVSAKVYTAELAFLFVNDTINVWNQTDGKEELLYVKNIRNAFIDGFEKGIQHFNDKWKLDRNTINAPLAEKFIRTIVDNYQNCGAGKKGGWKYVKQSVPLVLSESILNQYGYFSGIVSRADETINEFAPYFEEYLVQVAPEQSATEPQAEKNKCLMLKDLFTVEKWQPYIDVLTKCEPKILEKTKTGYKFVGKQKTEKGIVAGWAKYLKLKRIINVEISRDTIAATLSASIENFKIVGSSIDNRSTKYEKSFEPQLIELLNE